MFCHCVVCGVIGRSPPQRSRARSYEPAASNSCPSCVRTTPIKKWTSITSAPP